MKLKPKNGYFVSAAIACLALTQQVNAADEVAAKAPSPLDLAKQLSNPIANLISWPTRLDWDTDIGRLPLVIPQGAWRIMPYSIGGLAAYWTIDRVLSFMPLSIAGV
jgi:hypothetical protein